VVKKWVLLLIIASFLTQPTVKTVLYIQWKINQQEITRIYCINKNKPEMQCNGKCHLAQKMRKIEADYQQSKLPFAPKNAKSVDFTLFIQDIPPFVIQPIIVSTTNIGWFYLDSGTIDVPSNCFHPPSFIA
jgi:hypothetical protein